MSIVISTGATTAIDNLQDLIAEIRDLADDADYDENSILRAIRKAEAYIERELRSPQMEAETSLTLTSATANLPSDFLAVRSVVFEGQERELRAMSPRALADQYGATSGVPVAYAIEGRTIRIAPVGGVTLRLLYFAEIPKLSGSISSNWVLRSHPDLYVAGAMLHLSIRERDRDGVAMFGDAFNAVLQSMKRIEIEGRSSSMVPYGLPQVRGVRA